MPAQTFNFDEIELPEHVVTLAGHQYRVAEMTQYVAGQLQKLDKKYADMDEATATADKAAEMLIAVVSARLEPMNGGKAANTILTEQWKAGATSLARLRMLAQFVGGVDDPPE